MTSSSRTGACPVVSTPSNYRLRHRPYTCPMQRRLQTTALLLATLLITTGCLPSRVAIDLDPGWPDRVYACLRGPRLVVVRFASQGRVNRCRRRAFAHSTAGTDRTASNPVDRVVALSEAERDDLVRAVVLRVNSPGGTVGASETIYEEIRRFRERTGKPVIVSMSELAASGGYYISLPSDRIIAQPAQSPGPSA